MVIFDFDDGLSPEAQRKLHRTRICKRYMAERGRVGALAEAVLNRGGTLCDPALTAEVAALDALGRALRKQIDVIKRSGL